MKFILTFFVFANALRASNTNVTDETELAGISRITTIIRSYDKWVEDYGAKYKKLAKLTRAIERVRKYFTWWMRGNKKGCKPGPVESVELDALDALLAREIPQEAAMLKIITYQTQIKRLHRLFFASCSRIVNRKLDGIIARLTRDLTSAYTRKLEREIDS